MKVRVRDFFPPGFEYEKSCKSFIGTVSAAVVYSFIFLTNYARERSRLFYTVTDMGTGEVRKTLREGAQMAPFSEVIGYSFVMFIVVFVVVIYTMILQCLYYREGSKSIYLAKRLPDKWFAWRTCFTAPLIGLFIGLFVMGLMLAIYYGVYIGFTPAQCLP